MDVGRQQSLRDIIHAFLRRNRLSAFTFALACVIMPGLAAARLVERVAGAALWHEAAIARRTRWGIAANELSDGAKHDAARYRA